MGMLTHCCPSTCTHLPPATLAAGAATHLEGDGDAVLPGRGLAQLPGEVLPLVLEADQAALHVLHRAALLLVRGLQPAVAAVRGR